MKMGIGIGWPNATSGTAPVVLRSGWFNISTDCNGTVFVSTATIYVSNVNWQEGQYVYSNDVNNRLLLGTFYDSNPGVVDYFDVTGPAYNSCGL